MGATLPAAIVSPAIAAALGGDGRALTTQELTHNAGNQATGGIWRVAGPAGRLGMLTLVAAWGRQALAGQAG